MKTYLTFIKYIFFLLILTKALVLHGNKPEEAISHEQLDYQKRIKEQKNDNMEMFKGGADVNKGYVDKGILQENKCFTINEITLQGVTLLSKREQKKLTKQFLNQCLGVKTLKESLLPNIKNEYNKKGYVLAIPYLPNQNIKSGKVFIIVNEGHMEKIIYNKDVLTEKEVNWAFFNSTGKPINLRFTEQAIETLNTRNDYSITISYVPGKEVGSTVLLLQEEEKKEPKYKYKIQYTNDYNTVDDKNLNYKESRYQLYLSSANSVLPNDTWDTFANFNSDPEDLAGTFGLYYSIPFGYWTVNLDASSDLYRAVSEITSGDVVSKGLSSAVSIELNRTVFRNKDTIIKGFSKGNFYLSNNYIDDLFLQTSSYKLTYIDTGLMFQKRLNMAYITFNQTLSYGYPLFGIEKQGRNDNFYPQTIFTIYSAQGAYSKFFSNKMTFESLFDFQYTKDTLYSIKDFNAVGSQSVRGYTGIYSAYGTGFSVQNNLKIPLPQIKPNLMPTLILGYDIGGSLDENSFTVLNYKGEILQGWYTGFELSYKMLDFKFGLAGPMTLIPELDKNHIVFDFSMGISN